MCANILWKDSKRAPEAAELLRLTPADLLMLGIIDDLITEPIGGAHRDHEATGQQLRAFIRRYLAVLGKETLVEERIARFRAIGHFSEERMPQT
jgi:acetyl-CoA carboxylase carboxyl transferase subunit alpha